MCAYVQGSDLTIKIEPTGDLGGCVCDGPDADVKLPCPREEERALNVMLHHKGTLLMAVHELHQFLGGGEDFDPLAFPAAGGLANPGVPDRVGAAFEVRGPKELPFCLLLRALALGLHQGHPLLSLGLHGLHGAQDESSRSNTLVLDPGSFTVGLERPGPDTHVSFGSAQTRCVACASRPYG